MAGEGKGNAAFPKRTMHPVQPDTVVTLDHRVLLDRWPELDYCHGPSIPRCIMRRRVHVLSAEYNHEKGMHLYTARLYFGSEATHPFFTKAEARRGYVELTFWQDMITAVCD